jgi:hypothetical protein
LPTWGEILGELSASAAARGGSPDFDGVRRNYLARLHALTERNVIVYASDWLAGSAPEAAIILEDMQAMMEVCRGLEGSHLDLVLHSPGGSPEATASIVRYLRRKFDDIRVFVPIGAMSAATMWALAGNRIVMGKHSQLGPIDPQLVTPAGNKRLVTEWLEAYMFAGDKDAAGKAGRVADYFADYETHQSHSLGIDRDQAREVGVIVDDLEDDPRLQDAVLSVHHSTFHTFSGAAVKIVENQFGRGFFKMRQQVLAPVQGPQPQVPPGAQIVPGP